MGITNHHETVKVRFVELLRELLSAHASPFIRFVFLLNFLLRIMRKLFDTKFNEIKAVNG